MRGRIYSSDFSKLPKDRDFRGYVYVVEYTDGLLKVGRTIRPAARIATHKEHGDSFGNAMVRVWMSPPHVNFAANELTLIRAVEKMASVQRRKEYFVGCPFLAAVGLAQQLVYDHGPDPIQMLIKALQR
jgi:hypothetical protein